MGTLHTLYAAYRQLKDTERKQKEYQRLVGQELSYTILKDLINSAYHGVVISATLKDGTKLEIRREDPLDPWRKAINTGEYF